MPERRAPEDTVIDPARLDQEIDVKSAGRYYPEEYSSTISILSRKNKIKAATYESLAGTIAYLDDFQMKKFAEDESVRAKNEEMIAKQQVADREQLLKLDAQNKIFEMQQRLTSDLQTKFESLDNIEQGVKRVDAANEVFDNYYSPDEFAGIPALEKGWQSTLDKIKNDTLKVAGIEDIKDTRMQAQFNAKNMSSVYNAEVIRGTSTAIDGYAKWLKSCYFLKNLDVDSRNKICSEVYNEMIISEASFVQTQIQEGTLAPEKGAERLLNIIDKCNLVDFPLYDEQGAELKDSKGNPVRQTAGLDARTQQALLSTVSHLKSGSGNGAGDGYVASGSADKFDEIINYKELSTKGYSTTLLEKSTTDIEASGMELINKVMASGAGANTKINECQTIMEHMGLALTYARIRDLLNSSTDINTTVDQILTLTRELEGAITRFDAEGGWEKYQLSLKDAEGNIVISIATPDYLDQYPELGDKAKAASLYWKGAFEQLKGIRTVLESGNIGNIMRMCNQTINTKATAAVQGCKAKILLNSDGTGVNTTQVKALAEQFNYKAAGRNGLGFVPVAPSLIGDLVDSISAENGFDTYSKKAYGYQAIALALVQAGQGSAIYRALEIPELSQKVKPLFTAMIIGASKGLTNDEKQELMDVMGQLEDPEQRKLFTLKDTTRMLYGEKLQDAGVAPKDVAHFTPILDVMLAKNEGKEISGSDVKNLVKSLYISVKGLPGNISVPFWSKAFAPYIYMDSDGNINVDSKYLQVLKETQHILKSPYPDRGVVARDIDIKYDSNTEAFVLYSKDNLIKSSFSTNPEGNIGIICTPAMLQQASIEGIARANRAYIYNQYLLSNTPFFENTWKHALLPVAGPNIEVAGHNGEFASGTPALRFSQIYINKEAMKNELIRNAKAFSDINNFTRIAKSSSNNKEATLIQPNNKTNIHKRISIYELNLSTAYRAYNIPAQGRAATQVNKVVTPTKKAIRKVKNKWDNR